MTLADFADLLRRPVTDEKVVAFLGPRVDEVELSQPFAYVELKENGIEIVFSEAARVIPDGQIAEPTVPHLSAFHLHRSGHEGFSGCAGTLPGGIVLGEAEWLVPRKMGEPAWSGGGGRDSAGAWTPTWIRYQIGDDILHIQSDRRGYIEMVTLMAPDIRRPMPDKRQRLVVVSMPSRAALLWHREAAKGAPLIEREVMEICDNSAAVALPLMSAMAVEQVRGYRDITDDECWVDWQAMRADLAQLA